MKKKPASPTAGLAGFISFLTEVRQELAKVVWPTRQETIKLTAIVVGVSLFTALYIGLLDLGFTKLINLLLVR